MIVHFMQAMLKRAFRLTRIGDNGKEAVVGYSFEKEFICDYSSFLKRTTSVVNIQATTESVVYVVSLSDYFGIFKYRMRGTTF